MYNINKSILGVDLAVDKVSLQFGYLCLATEDGAGPQVNSQTIGSMGASNETRVRGQELLTAGGIEFTSGGSVSVGVLLSPEQFNQLFPGGGEPGQRLELQAPYNQYFVWAVLPTSIDLFS